LQIDERRWVAACAGTTEVDEARTTLLPSFQRKLGSSVFAAATNNLLIMKKARIAPRFFMFPAAQ
jgi:hypothetical protein